MQRMAIVGNATVRRDLTKLIDSCEIVVRFNEYRTIGKNTGHKTDILCVCNTGDPAKKISQNSSILRASFYSQGLEVWFPRNESVHKSYISQHCSKFNEENFYQDLSELITVGNQLAASQTLFFSPESNQAAFNKLLARARWPFVVPSTGFLAIEHILNEPRFAEYEKLLMGFSFRGWRGHPWEAEKGIILDYTKTRTDFHLIPIYPEPIARLHDIYSDYMTWKKRRKILKEL